LIEKGFFAEFPFLKNGTKFLHQDQTKITYQVSLSLSLSLSRLWTLLVSFVVVLSGKEVSSGLHHFNSLKSVHLPKSKF
jgi:hypothetical protein